MDNSPRRIIIDTDTASDDAVALVMALAAPGVRIEAITVVAGNVPLELGVQNALYTLELCGSSVPVYRGCAAPFLRELETAQAIHGRDGMGDIGLPLNGRLATPGIAVDVIRELVNRYPGEIELVTLAPLTTIAAAFIVEPGIAHKLKRCVIMGGIGSGRGNITPVAEYNIWVDPEAARIVFDSGAPIEMVGWDVSRTFATIDPAEAETIRGAGTKVAAFCVDIQRALIEYAVAVSGLAGFDLPDPVTMAVALDPSIVTASAFVAVEVDISHGPSRGQTIVDRRGVTKRAPNVTVIDAVSRAAFLAMLQRSVAAFA
jgi:purine nucleosidase